ncbi:phosphoglycerol transferase MdoB-like AlkP superfamily enzyme [Tumebacillus sp. BK434]|uniref:LTA synthase family protein n=1 Tax=Tumebacillus sp. BK434 TaxID=2512169 RepID=UPI00104B6B33|nr:LTA synthase family protein [Tumebacillus sp. BK434]TCP55429.1 phosphoglycerol transferase MdoB-like AlkP superfamily enzyme [Tumebacillus sp. BK434]
MMNPFMIFTVAFLAKIAVFQNLVFGEINVKILLLRELPFVLLVHFLIELIAGKRRLPVYFLASGIFSFAFLSIAIYHDFYGTLLTYQALGQAGQVGEVAESIKEIFNPWYLLFFTDLAFLFLYKKFQPKNKKIGRLNYAAVSLLSLVAVIVSIWQVDQKEIVNEMKKAEQMGVFNYQFALAVGGVVQEEEQIGEITQERIFELKGLDPVAKPQYFGVAKNKDVVVVQLESFQNFLIGLEIDGKEVTPNLNKLRKESAYFPNFYQQVGKGNTSDAEFMLNTSIYPVGDYAMSQRFGNKDIPSMAKLLKPYNYESATFHTNDIEFWNRDQLYEALGFDKTFDKQFFGEEEKVAFGASDRILYEKTVPELKKMKASGKHIYANLIAMSSHHPFKLPKELNVFTIPPELEGTPLGGYIESAAYVDAQIGHFISLLKANGLYDDTVLMLYGDHFGMGGSALNETEAAFMADWLQTDYTSLESFNVPLFIKAPGLKAQEVPTTGGQVDMMPTIANLLGVKLDDQIHFGQDLFNYSKNVLPERFYLPSGSFLNNEILFVPGLNYYDGKAVSLATQEETEKVSDYEAQFTRALELLRLSDGYMRSLPERQN